MALSRASRQGCDEPKRLQLAVSRAPSGPPVFFHCRPPCHTRRWCGPSRQAGETSVVCWPCSWALGRMDGWMVCLACRVSVFFPRRDPDCRLLGAVYPDTTRQDNAGHGRVSRAAPDGSAVWTRTTRGQRLRPATVAAAVPSGKGSLGNDVWPPP